MNNSIWTLLLIAWLFRIEIGFFDYILVVWYLRINVLNGYQVILEVPGWEQPRSLQLQVSRLVCSNYRSTDSGSRADLAGCLDRIQGQDGTAPSCAYSRLCFSSNFPTKEGDLSPISETLLKHATYPSAPSVVGGWKRNLLWSKDKSEVWFIHLDPFWADFFTSNSQTSRAKPMPFIGTVPVTAWIDPDKGFNESIMILTEKKNWN